MRIQATHPSDTEVERPRWPRAIGRTRNTRSKISRTSDAALEMRRCDEATAAVEDRFRLVGRQQPEPSRGA